MDTFFTQFKFDEQELFIDWLKGHLRYGPVKVVFLKKDGTERTMLCTTKEDLVEAYVKKTERPPNKDTCFVYDLEAKSWRSFRYDSVKAVSFTIE